jgi:3-phenylpropionate/trans-cinnamate dioxygenase ferredoxin reductase subunit
MAGLVIIGAGECGVRAAFTLRGKGFEGPITLLGREALHPYERPPLSKGMADELKLIRAETAYADAAIDLRLGTDAKAIDTVAKSVTLSDGSALDYEKLLIATGAHARFFPGMEGCLTLRTNGDAARIISNLGPGKRVGVIGGGFIGLELASTARRAGADVVVIEAGPALMARAVPSEIADHMHERHTAEGVDVRTSVKVMSANAETIILDDGTRLSLDLVIAGVGALPDASLAEAAGLAVENGVLVDGAFRTSASDVFAAGDCCNFPWRGQRLRLESWRAAQDQGEHAAAAMLGEVEDYAKVPWFWSDQFDLSLQVAGLFDPGRETVRRTLSDDAFLLFQRGAAGALQAAAGVGPGNAVAKPIRLAEKLIEREAVITSADLADPSVDLKRLLKAAQS